VFQSNQFRKELKSEYFDTLFNKQYQIKLISCNSILTNCSRFLNSCPAQFKLPLSSPDSSQGQVFFTVSLEATQGVQCGLFQEDCDHIQFLPLAFSSGGEQDEGLVGSLKKKVSRRNCANGKNPFAAGRRELEDILRIKGFSSESESEPEATFHMKKKMLHRGLTPKRLSNGTNEDSGSDSAKDQVNNKNRL
jgi:hypothetical protein